MKQRSFFSRLAIAAVVLLVLGFGGFYLLLGQNPATLITGGPKTAPEAAIFVPRTAPAMVSLLVNPDRVESVQQVLTRPFQRKNSQSELNRVKKILLGNTGLNYKRDIQPWLGNEITWALVSPDLDRQITNGQQPGYLVALSTKNSEKSRESLDAFWQKQVNAGLDVAYEQYRGVKIIYLRPFSGRPDDTPTLVTATVSDRFVLFSNYPKVMREALNTVQANINLTQSDSYQKALEELQNGRVAFAYFNLGDWKLTNPTKADFIPQQPTFAVSVGINPKGLLAETVLIAATEEDKLTSSEALFEPIEALQYITKSSPLMISGKDLNQLWKEFSEIVAFNPALEQFVTQPIEGLKQLWGLDLPQDIFSWVTGEYVLAVVPRPEPTIPDWIFVTERSENTENAIKNLDEIATNQGYTVGSFDLNNNTMTAWTKLKPITIEKPEEPDTEKPIIQAKPKGLHTNVGQYEIFTTSVETMEEALQAQTTGNLITEDPDFQSSLDVLPPSNEGYFYLNWLNSRKILKQQIPLFKLVELSAKPFFDHLQSFTISSTDRIGNIRKASLFVRFR